MVFQDDFHAKFVLIEFHPSPRVRDLVGDDVGKRLVSGEEGGRGEGQAGVLHACQCNYILIIAYMKSIGSLRP